MSLDVPITVDAMLPDEPKSTLRERMRVTRESYCWTCHSKMDPFGIALENFDVIGRWRDQYTDVSNYAASEKNHTGRFPVDARTVHKDGRAFEGPQGLKTILMEDKDRFSRAFVENMLSYAMARQLTFGDRENLDLLYRQSADTDFKLRDILLAIVSSDYFTRR